MNEITNLFKTQATVPTFDQAMNRLIAALEAFDVNKIRQEDIARSAVYSAPPAS